MKASWWGIQKAILLEKEWRVSLKCWDFKLIVYLETIERPCRPHSKLERGGGIFESDQQGFKRTIKGLEEPNVGMEGFFFEVRHYLRME